jgi:ABC-2 type transport system permease protein
MTSSPIADLSYRNYDGPLMPANMRWWVIAKSTMMIAFRKRSMWVSMAFSAWYYLAMIFVLYFVNQSSQAAGAIPGHASPSAAYLDRIIWKDQFLLGFSYGQIMFLVIALIIGAGAIANDNRANALLVYLSKPCTKTDYLFGKWVGVFLPLLAVMLIPATIFYAYGALSFRAEGFLYDDKWLYPQIVLMFVLGAAFYSSLAIGFSSMFRQGRIAGATFAGLYFITNFFTFIMAITFLASSEAGRRHPHGAAAIHNFAANLYYASVDGITIGMSKVVLGTDGSIPFGLPGKQEMVSAPSPIVIFILLGLSALSLFIAWTRIRAVEVVG